MDLRSFPQSTDAKVLRLSPSRAELVRFFAWGYLNRRELTERLRDGQPTDRRRREPHVPTAA